MIAFALCFIYGEQASIIPATAIDVIIDIFKIFSLILSSNNLEHMVKFKNISILWKDAIYLVFKRLTKNSSLLGPEVYHFHSQSP